jgi:hypothetical protein
LVTVAFAVLAFLVRRTKLNSRWVRYGMVGGFLVFALLKGSAPGGAGARADFEAANAASVTT